MSVHRISLPNIHSPSENHTKVTSLVLNEGDIIKAKIIGNISKTQAILQIAGRQVVARTSVMLPEGTDANFRVVHVRPACVLKLVEPQHVPSENGLGTLKGLGSSVFDPEKLFAFLEAALRAGRAKKKEAIPSIAKRIENLCSRVLPGKRGVESAGVKTFLEGCGFLWENKLRKLVLNHRTGQFHLERQIDHDLKGLALQAMAEKGGSHVLNRGVIETFVDHIQKFQLLNLSGLEEKGRLLFFIPVQFDDGMRFAQLLLDLGDRQQKKEISQKNGVIRASLFLEMTRLGPVRVDATMNNKSIVIGFIVTEHVVQKIVDDHVSILRDQLERHGFSVSSMRCRIRDRKDLEGTNFVTALVTDEKGQINVII